MKKLLAVLLAMLMLTAAMLPAALAEKTATVYVSSGGGSLNLRGGPGKDYASKGYVDHGAKVTIKDTSGEWSKVKVNDTGKTGWIKTKYIDGTTKDLGTGTKKVSISGGGSLVLRGGPGTSYSKKGYVKDGASVKVLETEDDWVRVKVTSTGKTGWIKAKYIGASGSKPESGAEKPSASEGAVYHTTGKGLNLRKGAGTKYASIGKLPKGTAVKCLSTSGNWMRVETFDGQEGWISKNYLAAGATARVNSSTLNIRKGAGTSYGIVHELKKGDVVTVDSVSKKWSHVTSGKYTGWVFTKYIDF